MATALHAASLVATAGTVLLLRSAIASAIGKDDRRYGLGAIVGKFYPPHLGHSYLIEEAERRCDEVTVVVCWREGEDPPGPLRASWLRRIHPNVNVLCEEDVYNDDGNSRLWADLTVNKFLKGRKPDAVFTSESYGKAWAECIGCDHICVDMKRAKAPVSGSIIRADPYSNYNFMHPAVRQYYSKLVVIIGAESTGKTVLTSRLAFRFFGAGMVQEYGREKTEQNLKERTPAINGADFTTPEWRSEDFMEIALEQSKRIEESLADCPLVIADTDARATQVWHYRYMGKRSSELDEILASPCFREPDLYLFCVTDGVPFVQDGTRDGESSGAREWMNKEFETILKSRPNTIVLDGSFEDRFLKAVDAIIERFPAVAHQFED